MNGIWYPKYRARTIVHYLNRLCLGNVEERTSITQAEWYLNRIRFAKEASVSEWNVRTAGFVDLFDHGNAIMRMGVVGVKDLFVFRDKSVDRVAPHPDALHVMKDVGVQTTHGIWSPGSLQKVYATPRASDPRFRLIDEESFIYLGRDDFYRIDLSTCESIGQPIRREFFNAVNDGLLAQAWSFQDSADKKYYFVCRLKDATQHAWIYDWEEKTWSRQDFSDYSTVGSGHRATLGGRRLMSLFETVVPHEEVVTAKNLEHKALAETVTPAETISMVKS
jgi:hypothetical protein